MRKKPGVIFVGVLMMSLDKFHTAVYWNETRKNTGSRISSKLVRKKLMKNWGKNLVIQIKLLKMLRCKIVEEERDGKGVETRDE